MRFFVGIIITVAFVATLVQLSRAGTPGTGCDPARSRANIIALARIRAEVVDGGRQARFNRDQAVFLEFLDQRIKEECARLQREGRPLVGLPCPAQGLLLPQQKARTAAEEVAALDGELSGLLGEFDEMLLAEQERLARQRQEAGNGGRAGAGRGGGGKNGAREGVARDSSRPQGDGQGAQTTENRAGNDQDHKNGRDVTGKKEQGKTGPAVRKGAEPGRDRLQEDDDIVARQLREAAEKEQDPELKEKLWQEYRKYKEGR